MRASQAKPGSSAATAVQSFAKRAAQLLAQELSSLASQEPTKDIPTTAERISGDKRTIGVCFSGGGIRSASYNLGALQVLARGGWLAKAKYIAAVSGGAYIASAHAIAVKEASKAASASEPIDPPSPTVEETFRQRSAFARGSPEEQYLRNHTSYLAPTPLAKLSALANWLLGFLLNIALLGIYLFVAAYSLGWLFSRIHPCLSVGDPRCQADGPAIENHLWIGVPALIVLLGFALFAAVALLDLGGRWSHRLRRWSRMLTNTGAILVLLLGLPYALPMLSEVFNDPRGFISAIRSVTESKPQADVKLIQSPAPSVFLWVAPAITFLNVVAASLRLITARKRSIYALIVAALAGPMLVFLPFLAVLVYATERHSVDLSLMFIGAAMLVFETTYNCNRTTLHFFYARRLSGAFALHRVSESEAQPLAPTQRVKLSEYQPEGRPQYLYCAAANALADGNTPPGRNSVPFVFANDWCGGGLTRQVATSVLESKMRSLSVPAAIAISGAAFSPTMGKYTKRLYTFLLTLMNARLGVWVPNPRFLQTEAHEVDSIDRGWRSRLTNLTGSILRNRPAPRPGMRYFLYELIGWHRLDRRYVYVTDGGHYDNLGLVELLRRGCTTIFCFDASGDSVDTFNTLGEAISLARADLMVETVIEPEDLAPSEEGGWSRTDHVVGTFRYPSVGDEPPEEGVIVFAKAAVTRNAPWDVRAFRRKDANFPNHSTADQLFTDQKFESYRRLGEQACERAVDGLARYMEKKERVRQAWPEHWGPAP